MPNHLQSLNDFRVSAEQKQKLSATYTWFDIFSSDQKARFLCAKLGKQYILGMDLRELEKLYWYQFL